ncbi:MAG TPA: hypothetical protein VLJ68_04445 [Chitinophagaceae bacterium]|nr:hypothetical protein [Chitinophagaceae bacterium]
MEKRNKVENQDPKKSHQPGNPYDGNSSTEEKKKGFKEGNKNDNLNDDEDRDQPETANKQNPKQERGNS